MKEWDLIVEEKPLPGSQNMARDEFLFRSLQASSPTSVRFYQWARPTVSVGYSQTIDKVVRLEFCRQHGVDIVRRITGGKLVLHHREITYCVCSSDTDVFSSSLTESYRAISLALIQGLAEMGLEARLAGQAPLFYRKGHLPCFSFPAADEVEIRGCKVIGSAQKRVGSTFLQHGSILLEDDADLLRRVVATFERIGQLRMISLSEALGRKVDFGWAVERLKRGFEKYFGIQFRPRVFSAEELRIIDEIARKKYAAEDWTLRRLDKAVDFFEPR